MSSEIFGMDPGEFGFMAEAEGQSDLIDTRDAKINAILNDLRRLKLENPGLDPMDYIDEVIENQGLEVESLTAKERSKIDRIL